jgi:transcriptional regulator of arginine metabolism
LHFYAHVNFSANAMTKAERQKAILALIRETRVATQHDLCELLFAKHGVECDQATVSRDVKELRLARLSDGEGHYYASPGAASAQAGSPLARLIRSVECSGNLLVIRTDAANAHPVAEAIDRLGFDEIIGTVAGDNTLFAALREGVAGEAVRQKLLGKVKKS